LKPGELTVTSALFVPISLYCATCGDPEHVTKTPGLLPQVTAPAWLMLTTSLVKLEPVSTMTPKSRFCSAEIDSGLNTLAVAVAWVAGLTAAAGVLVSASVAKAPAVARNLFMVPIPTGSRSVAGAGRRPCPSY
jgi:hypothetical protein